MKTVLVRLAFPINAHRNANQKPIGSAPSYRVQCTLPPRPMCQTLLFDFSRVWFRDYRAAWMLNQLRRGHRAWPMFELKSGAAMAAPAAPMPPPLHTILNVTVSEPHTCSVIATEPHSGNSSVSHSQMCVSHPWCNCDLHSNCCNSSLNELHTHDEKLSELQVVTQVRVSLTLTM